MKEKHKSYGYEGGYDDWSADKVYKNMRLMEGDKQGGNVEETEDAERSESTRGYEGRAENREE